MSTPVAPATKLGESVPARDEIRVYSHSNLFYWWPVWFFGLIFAMLTWIDGGRLAIVHHDSLLVREKVMVNGAEKTQSRILSPDDGYRMDKVVATATDSERDALTKEGVSVPAGAELKSIKPRVSHRSWMGPSFLFIMLLVVVITNVPLRGLWSLIVLIGMVVAALLISLFGWWDDIFQALGGLHVFVNMAGYLLIALVLVVLWVVSVFIFDRRSYIVFTPGQIRVCEEIGGRERVYDTTGLTIEKHRDDWFRHIILGFGTGDMTIRTAGADRHEIVMPNIALIGFKIDPIQHLIRQRQIEVETRPPA